jgi:hypothetical protein
MPPPRRSAAGDRAFPESDLTAFSGKGLDGVSSRAVRSKCAGSASRDQVTGTSRLLVPRGGATTGMPPHQCRVGPRPRFSGNADGVSSHARGLESVPGAQTRSGHRHAPAARAARCRRHRREAATRPSAAAIFSARNLTPCRSRGRRPQDVPEREPRSGDEPAAGGAPRHPCDGGVRRLFDGTAPSHGLRKGRHGVFRRAARRSR